jgi:hypothetical protein
MVQASELVPKTGALRTAARAAGMAGRDRGAHTRRRSRRPTKFARIGVTKVLNRHVKRIFNSCALKVKSSLSKTISSRTPVVCRAKQLAGRPSKSGAQRRRQRVESISRRGTSSRRPTGSNRAGSLSWSFPFRLQSLSRIRQCGNYSGGRTRFRTDNLVVMRKGAGGRCPCTAINLLRSDRPPRPR